MLKTFDEIIEVVLEHEGGYVNDWLLYGILVVARANL